VFLRYGESRLRRVNWTSDVTSGSNYATTYAIEGWERLWDGRDDGLKDDHDQRFESFPAGKENRSWMYSEKGSSHLRSCHL